MYMKKFLKLTLAVVLMVSATAVNAQKFGRVDLASVVTSMAEFKTAQANLEAYARDLQEQLEQMQVEFNMFCADYQKNVSTYDEAFRQLKERELSEKMQRIQDFQQIAQQDIAKKESEEMASVYEKADQAVKQVASAGGYIAIFSTASDQPASAGLAYFDPAQLTDITLEVKAALGIQ